MASDWYMLYVKCLCVCVYVVLLQGGHSFSQLEFQDISRISRTFLTIFPGQFGMGIEFFA